MISISVAIHPYMVSTDGHPDHGHPWQSLDAMDTFDCHGWLFITVTEGSDIVKVKFQHKDDHVPYWNIDVPKEVKDLVHNNPNMTPTQVRGVRLKFDINK